MTKFAERKKKWGTEMVFKSISLPENIIAKLKLLKEQYEAHYNRQVSYGEIFERLFSPIALGNVDPGVYSSFASALKSRAELDELVTRSTMGIIDNSAEREDNNNNSIREEETNKEQQAVTEKEARCIEIIRKADPERPKPSWWATDEWYVNPDTGKYYAVLKGKEGKSDYARTDGEVLGQVFCSENLMLSEECGFLRVKVPFPI